MNVAKVGCDVARRSMRLCVLFRKEQREADFANDAAGFVEALEWLRETGARKFEIALEPTGRDGEAFADFFWAKPGMRVFYVQPEKFKKYAGSRDLRVKSDRKDAIALAKYLCDPDRNTEISEWKPKTDLQLELRDVQMRVRSITKRLSGLRCQLACGLSSKRIRREIEEEIKALEHNKQELIEYAGKLIQLDERLAAELRLLMTVPGVGFQTGVFLLCMIDFHKFGSSRKLACYLGLTQRKHESGETIKWKEHISKKGRTEIRSALYYQSWVAIFHNPPIREFSQRIRSKRPNDVGPMRVACLRKLITICWAVVVRGKEFDPDYKNPLAS